jgi:hypothetical protein
MRNLFIIIITTLTLLCSCNEDNAKDTSAENYQLKSATVNLDAVFVPFNIPFPDGTKYEIKGSKVHFTLPDSYYAVGIDADGNFHKSAVGGSGSITCECTEGSGCDPIVQGDEAGCLMKNGCSKCSKTKTEINGVSQSLDNLIIIYPFTNLFIKEFDQIKGHYFLPSDFVEYPEILEVLSKIKSEQDKTPESEKEVVFINVFGYIVPIEVKMNGDNFSVVGSDITCTCNVSGSCPKEKHWTGVVWCNSNNCTNCTMSGVAVNSKMISKHFTSENGKIALKD